MQGTAVFAGVLRLPVRPAYAPAGGARAEGPAGLPGHLSGLPGTAGGDQGDRYRDARHRGSSRDGTAGHGRPRVARWPARAPGPRRVLQPVRGVRQSAGSAAVPGTGRRRALMKILATYNIKGGVGKTAAAVNLSYLAAADGLRVLIADLDPQAAATYLFRVRPRVKGGGAALIRGSRELDKAIKGTDFEGLDLLPADFTFRNLDQLLDDTKKPTQRLARLLRPLRASYD